MGMCGLWKSIKLCAYMDFCLNAIFWYNVNLEEKEMGSLNRKNSFVIAYAAERQVQITLLFMHLTLLQHSEGGAGLLKRKPGTSSFSRKE